MPLFIIQEVTKDSYKSEKVNRVHQRHMAAPSIVSVHVNLPLLLALGIWSTFPSQSKMLASLVDVDCRFAYLNDPRVTAWHPDGRLRVISERGNESGIVSTVLAIAIDPNRILTNQESR